MRCPKCQYISFDNGERCRNCGYEFSLTSAARGLDLPIQTGDEPLGPLVDLALDLPARTGHDAAKAVDTVGPASRPITSSFDLPLFKERRAPDGSSRAITPPATPTPRPPLAVRRSTPVPPRSANRTVDEPVLRFGFDEPPSPSPSVSRPSPAVTATESEPDGITAAAASFGPRLFAALIDAGILAAIGSIVLYFTMRICGVPLSRIAVIPPIPFASFLVLIAGGYFTLFTAAGGQTIGKMASGIKVVSIDFAHRRVPLGHSVLRAVAYVISALPAGIGFLPALVGADRRAIHDRLADTRVVKA
jgi:uncharacterized RDD family membrane protein YckC